MINLTLVVVTLLGLSGPARAAQPMSLGDVKDSLLARDEIGARETKRALSAIERFVDDVRQPIAGVITASGFNASLIYGRGTWRNVAVSFKDGPETKVSNCLYDMIYDNSGLVVSAGYKWIIMVLLGRTAATDLGNATYGRGLGFSWYRYFLGLELQYLPARTHDGGMLVITPNVGVNVGLQIPKVTFVPARACPL